MTYAPIIIPTLSRDVHFIRLLESLRRNSWAKFTDVYVGLDYPPSDAHKDGFNKICAYLDNSFSEFNELIVIKQKKNIGSSANLRSLINVVTKKYDRFIKTDDDAEFSPNFLEYMNLCLEKYKEEPDIIAVTGYSYPIGWKTSKGATILKENFSCPMWGTGFWREKYREAYNSITIERRLRTDVGPIIKSKAIDEMLDVAKYEFINLCLSPDFEKTLAARMSDVSFRMYTAIQKKYIIVPTVSKVRNWGFDGTGVYCLRSSNTGKIITARNYDYTQQIIDSSDHFILREDTLEDNEWNRKLMNEFDPLPMSKRLKMKIKLILFHIVGHKGFNKLTYFVRRFR